MTTSDCQEIKEQIADWLSEHFIVQPLADNGCLVIAPMLDRNRNHLEFYVDDLGNDNFRLSDDGTTLAELSMSGVDIEGERRREIFESILRSHGVRSESDRLVIEASQSGLASSANELIQAIIEVGGMTDLTYSSVHAIFVEDVKAYLRAKDIQVSENVRLEGRSGLSNSFDFLLVPSDSSREKIVKVIGSPVRSEIDRLLFAWTDVRQVRPKTEAYAIVNDRDQAPNATHLAALANYDIASILWSERDHQIEALVS